LYDVETGQEIRRFTGHTDEVCDIVFSPICATLTRGLDGKENTVQYHRAKSNLPVTVQGE